ncbi:hypothetical protein AB5I41_29225 [Sphingomonas sp. MMS24-JH45]
MERPLGRERPRRAAQAAELTIARDDGRSYRFLFLVGTGAPRAQTPAGSSLPPPDARPRRSAERGAALLTVLLLVAVVAVLAATALERLRLWSTASSPPMPSRWIRRAAMPMPPRRWRPRASPRCCGRRGNASA